MSETRNFYN